MEQAQEIVNPETVPSMDTQCFRDYLPLLTGHAAEMRGPPAVASRPRQRRTRLLAAPPKGASTKGATNLAGAKPLPLRI